MDNTTPDTELAAAETEAPAEEAAQQPQSESEPVEAPAPPKPSRLAAFAQKHNKTLTIAGMAVGFRLAVYALSVLIIIMFGNYDSPVTFEAFLDTWSRWDSPHYIDIAQYGYAGALENGEPLFLVFYPLLPWCLRALHFVFGDYRLCGLILDTVCFAIGCVYLHKITEQEYGTQAANNAVLLLSVYPFAFFYGAVLTESLFFALCTVFFYELRRHRWGGVVIFGALACMTKTQGVVLALSVAAEIIYSARGITLLRQRKIKQFLNDVILPGCFCAMMLSGFLVYLLINYKVSGDPLRFLYYQSNHWNNSFLVIWKTIPYLFQYWLGGWYTSTGAALWAPEIALLFIYIAWLVQGVRRRLRPIYYSYLAAMFLVTYSSSWLISGGRYSLCALPAFMLMGDWCARHRKFKTPAVCLSTMLFTVYLVGFMTGRQIM